MRCSNLHTGKLLGGARTTEEIVAEKRQQLEAREREAKKLRRELDRLLKRKPSEGQLALPDGGVPAKADDVLPVVILQRTFVD